MSAISGFPGAYFDGRTSRRHDVTARVEGADLVLMGGDLAPLQVPLMDVLVVPAITGEAHILHLPGGAVLRTSSLPPSLPGARWERGVRALEARWSAAIVSVAFIASFAAWMFFHGIPTAARIAAARMPDSVKRDLGQQTMDLLDRGACRKTRLPEARLKEVDALLARITRGMQDWGKYGVYVKSCPIIGPNALALPDGSIVVTEELVLGTQDDEEIAAVLAHEVGHIRRDHSMRLALQGAGVAGVIAIIGSDAISISGLAFALPTLLLETGYSRKFEDEADEFALRRLPEIGISPGRLADALVQLEKAHAAEKARRGDKDVEYDYLSTHPATAARIARSRAAARGSTPGSGPAPR